MAEKATKTTYSCQSFYWFRSSKTKLWKIYHTNTKKEVSLLFFASLLDSAKPSEIKKAILFIESLLDWSQVNEDNFWEAVKKAGENITTTARKPHDNERIPGPK